MKMKTWIAQYTMSIDGGQEMIRGETAEEAADNARRLLETKLPNGIKVAINNVVEIPVDVDVNIKDEQIEATESSNESNEEPRLLYGGRKMPKM